MKPKSCAIILRCMSNAAIKENILMKFKSDSMTNVPESILSKTRIRLHNIPNSPLCILKEKIQNWFDKSEEGIYEKVSMKSPIVSIRDNFDALLIPKNHISRSRSDTYYINSDHVLRTHTSAHQSSLLSSKSSMGYLVTADVYRRDEIDATHYPVFHQMEGIRYSFLNDLIFRKFSTNGKRLFSRNELELEKMTPKINALAVKNSSIQVSDTELSTENGYQSGHLVLEQHVVTKHLKNHLEGLFAHLFQSDKQDSPLKMRWIEGYFPFTQPSWELEVEFRGKWLEVCGCGMIQQKILESTGNHDKVGWAFGLGLERIAMVLFDIPDIRLFWSNDDRFVSQFESGKISKFVPFSKYPSCYKDISFWCDKSFHDNDFSQIVRDVAEDLAESVSLIDTFVHPKSGKTSKCYRIQYRSFERTLANDEVDKLHENVGKMLVKVWNVEIR